MNVCSAYMDKFDWSRWESIGIQSVMYLFACRKRIKMKSFFPISNHKILYFAILIICRKNLSQSGCTDCKIMTIEGKKKLFWWDTWIIVKALKLNRN
jgi:hypothetical protein